HQQPAMCYTLGDNCVSPAATLYCSVYCLNTRESSAMDYEAYRVPRSGIPGADGEEGYDVLIQQIIEMAFQHIQLDPSDQSFVLVCTDLARELGARSGSKRQWMDVTYLRGRANYAEGNHDVGLPLLECALSLAFELQDLVAIPDIAEPLGDGCRCVGASS